MQVRDRHILVFEVAGQRVGLPADDVVEIHRAAAISPLPGAPDMVEGVIDLRGRLVPVIDVRARLGLPRRALDVDDHFIIVSDGGPTAALWVDRVLAMHAVRATAVGGASADTDLAGVVAVDGVPVAVKPAARFLAPLHELRSATDAR